MPLLSPWLDLARVDESRTAEAATGRDVGRRPAPEPPWHGPAPDRPHLQALRPKLLLGPQFWPKTANRVSHRPQKKISRSIPISTTRHHNHQTQDINLFAF